MELKVILDGEVKVDGTLAYKENKQKVLNLTRKLGEIMERDVAALEIDKSQNVTTRGTDTVAIEPEPEPEELEVADEEADE